MEQLPRLAIEDADTLRKTLDDMIRRAKGRRLVAVIDQYEQVATQRTAIPSAFVETLSLLDRGRARPEPVLFIWLTTSRQFQADLANATSWNKRILVAEGFEIVTVQRVDWPAIIQETF